MTTKIVMHAGSAPESLIRMLRRYEAIAYEEVQKQHPNIQLLEREMEVIEDHADAIDIHLDWLDGVRCPSVRMSGACFGVYLMTDAVPVKPEHTGTG